VHKFSPREPQTTRSDPAAPTTIKSWPNSGNSVIGNLESQEICSSGDDLPLPDAAADPVAHALDLQRERCLLLAALTRGVPPVHPLKRNPPVVSLADVGFWMPYEVTCDRLDA
jgi:hypothetical protein